MKNKIFAFILAGICLVGCSLEEKPYGFYSEGNYYKTEADAQSATMYIYDAINYIEYSRAIVFLGGMNTDELDPKGDATQSTKDLDASIFFNGVFGNDVINTQRFGQPSNNPLRWTPDNPNNDYPKLRDDRQTKFSDWWVEDGTFIRIQTVSLGYTIPLRKSLRFMDSIRLYEPGRIAGRAVGLHHLRPGRGHQAAALLQQAGTRPRGQGRRPGPAGQVLPLSGLGQRVRGSAVQGHELQCR